MTRSNLHAFMRAHRPTWLRYSDFHQAPPIVAEWTEAQLEGLA